MEAYKLSEVNLYIKQVIAANFNEPLWIKAEISQIKESRGHYYLELIEKAENSDEVVAKMSAVLWIKARLFIQKKLGELADQILQDGTEIQCKIAIDFHSKFGLKFTIEDIDAAYTFGKLEIERQKTIERLKNEELLHKNRISTTLPPVIQNIAIISSKTAAGLQDFEKQLSHNSYEYYFRTTLFPASMQGINLESDIIQQLNNIAKSEDPYDCVVIIRGGGSKLDLSGFDSYNLAKIVADFKIPVLSGVGHDIDQNVIELVVYEALKTPTAVATRIINHNMNFEATIIELQNETKYKVQQLLETCKRQVDILGEQIKYQSYQLISNTEKAIEKINSTIFQKAKINIIEQRNLVEVIYQKITLLDPTTILLRGYSILYKGDEVIKSINQLNEQDEIVSYLNDGQISSTVKKISKVK